MANRDSVTCMTTPRSRALIATAAGVAVLAGATLVTFASVGCGNDVSAAAAAQYKTPGVYIVSVESFGAGFAGFVRDANPGCE